MLSDIRKRKGKIVVRKEDMIPKYLKAIYSKFYPLYIDNTVKDLTGNVTLYGYSEYFEPLKENVDFPEYGFLLIMNSNNEIEIQELKRVPVLKESKK